MTEREAEALAARLTRIWGLNDRRHWSWQEDTLRFFLNFSTGLRFAFIDGPFVKQHLSLSLKSLEDGSHIGLSWQDSTGEIVVEMSDEDGGQSYGERVTDLQTQEFQVFAAEWMPFFRRGCWLSGVPIEASAHEKAEWIRGFSREELEAWSLEM